MTLLHSIPNEHRDAVASALNRAFGDAAVALVERLTGVSALGVFHIDVEGHGHFVLRLDPRKDVLRDTDRQAVCIRLASDGGVTPEHVFNDAASGVSIARFVAPHQAPWANRLAEAAGIVRRMHDLPLFPELAPYRQNMEMVRGILAEKTLLPPDIQPAVLAAFDQALEAYPWDGDIVSSHNDLNPSNMVFDGTRTWIVDWETAFAADRYVDIATLANWLVSTQAGEDQILIGYFGAEPTDDQRARLYLMRQINRLFYGAMMLFTAAQPGFQVSEADWQATPTIGELRPQMSRLAVLSGRVQFGCAFLKDALAGIEAETFAAARRMTRA